MKQKFSSLNKLDRTDSIKKRFINNDRRMRLLLMLCFLLLVLSIACAICIGSANISLKMVFKAVLSRFMPGLFPVVDEVVYNIIWQLRLPRIMLSVFAGAGLSSAGAVMQALTRNPLVSPFTVGISNAAAFGASMFIMLGIRIAGSVQTATVFGAFVFAMLCAVLVYGIANRAGSSPVSLVLTGTALTYLFSALTNTIQYLINDDKLAAVVHWTFGSFTKADAGQILLLLVVIMVTFPVFIKNAWALNALASGSDDVARGLGIDVNRVRIILGLLSVTLTACIISLSGVIGFVGIVGPHIARIMIGADHKYLLPFSAFTGGMLVLVSDTLGRTLFAPIIIPVGIVVAYVGVPLFLQLILSRKELYFK
ncbi:MAG: iron ABC transporter permease [Eubacteriales bacterium]|nr:iron ABC transporter permease [Eubacteriales bacterium]